MSSWLALATAENMQFSKWKHDYNILHPHSALGNMTPIQFRLAAEDENRPLKENKLDSTGNIKLVPVS